MKKLLAILLTIAVAFATLPFGMFDFSTEATVVTEPQDSCTIQNAEVNDDDIPVTPKRGTKTVAPVEDIETDLPV